jgi:CBS domain-containing protein
MTMLADVMSTDVLTVPRDAPLSQVAPALVLDDGQVVGVVSVRDLLLGNPG